MNTEQKRGRGRPRKYFTIQEVDAARKAHRDTYRDKVQMKSFNIYGSDLELLRELAANSGTSMMRYFSELVRKAKEDSDAAA